MGKPKCICIVFLLVLTGTTACTSQPSSPPVTATPSPTPTATAIPTRTPTPTPGVLIHAPLDMVLPEGSAAWILPDYYIGGVAYSPNGDWLAVASLGSVFVYQSDSLQLQITLQAESGLVDVAWSPDGTRLAGGSQDGRVWVWDTTAGDILSAFKVGDGLVGNVVWSPDGTRLASGVYGGSTRIWNAITGEDTVLLDMGYDNAYPFVSWSPDGTQLAGGCMCDAGLIWDTVTGKQLLRFEGYNGELSNWVQSIAWSPTGDRLAMGLGMYGAILIYDPVTGDELARLEGPRPEIQPVVWSPDGDLLASGSADGTVHIWDMGTMQEIMVLDYLGLLGNVAELSDGGYLVLDDIAWSPDGNYLATGVDIVESYSAEHVDGILILWNASRLP